MNTSIQVYPTSDGLARAAAELFVTLAREAIAAQGRFSVALSGGSTPRAMHVHLASAPLASQVDWTRVHLFWGDERCVPPDHADSNYRMAHETLLAHVPVPTRNIHRIHGEDAPTEAALAYERDLRAHFAAGLAQPSAPAFDLIWLGMGDDGHTASLFPGTAAIHERERWVVSLAHTTPPAPLVSRITLTPLTINAAAQVVFLVAGKSKAARLRQVWHEPYQPDMLPSQIVKPHGGKLVWMVDEAAGR